MKKLLFFLALLLLVSCQHEEYISQSTSAAKEIYKQYAKRNELTVALIGGYQGYNAVMLQAQTREEWLHLCEEFGVQKNVDTTNLDSVKINSLAISHASTDNEAMLQPLFKEIEKENPHISISVDSCITITSHVHYDHGKRVDSTTEVSTNKPNNNQLRLTQTALQHGNTGYIVYDDSEKLTLWLFFYSNTEEKDQIINNITLKH